MKEEMKNSTGIMTEALSEKYLGLPTAVGRSSKEAFEHIPGKICGLMGGWGEKLLSCVARETLIKSVAQAIPTYSTSCFLLSPSTCKKITSATSNYWWSSKFDRRGLHWRRWSELTLPKCHGGMGFKDIKLFNIAMLGKQGWRLMTNQSSLCARVLKGKYFPHGDFLEARNKRNSSHTWRAILAGRKTLELGLIKRIGDGRTTNIWSDRWIPGAIGGKPICRLESGSANTVSDLIEHSGGFWNEQTLAQNFIHADAQAIRRIPLGRARDDFWAWEGERHGLYTVRSAYRALVEKETQERDFKSGQPSHSAGNNNPLWRKIWKIKVPPKVRVFWWRVAHDFIPSRANLFHRHIERLGTCEFCGAYEETTFHALTECTFARQFWRKLTEITGIKLPKLCPHSWAQDVMDDSCCKERDRGIILCGMWSLWNSRNDRRHGKAAISSELAIDWATDVCFQLLTDSLSHKKEGNTLLVEKWCKPANGHIKVNTDRAYTASDFSGGTGAVIRRADGSFIAASARRLDSVASALLTEVEALRDGLRLIPQGTLERVTAETDSQELVSLWRSRGEDRSELTAIFSDVQDLAATFTSFELVHVRRSANFAAHLCARNGCNSSSALVWVEQPPSFLQHCLLNDCNDAA